MKINQNSKIRFQIILIAILGGLVFCGYLLFSHYVSLSIQQENKTARVVQYPVIQLLVKLDHELSTISDSLSDAVAFGDEIFLEDTDMTVRKFHQLVADISQINPELVVNIYEVDASFSTYYIGARALSLRLVNDPGAVASIASDVLASNDNYRKVDIGIQNILEEEQEKFSVTLKNITDTIQTTYSIGLLLGVVTIVGLFGITWLVSLNVLRLINKSDQLKKDFLSTMSHELRTPMNGISGAIQLLGSTTLNDQQKEFLDVADQSFSSMKMTVDDILTFSDFMSEQPIIRESYVDLYKELQLLLSEMKRLADRKSLALIEDSTNVESMLVRCDGAKVLHVIQHLITNAVKFTEAGCVNFHMEYIAPTSARDNGRVLVVITDTGVGVPDEMLSEIFKPFRQLDASFRRAHQGLGLGLAMSKSISDSMNGSIGFENRKDQHGAVVTFSFPANVQMKEKAVTTEGKTTAKQGEEKRAQLSSRDGAKKKILVVEDNNVNQLVIKGLLKRLGYQVLVAENGLRALEVLPESNVALILMDCQMPVMDGFESTRNIRKLSAPLCHIPIVAVTANTMDGDRERCLEAGMNEYLKKPLELDVLKQTLEEQLDLTGSTHF